MLQGVERLKIELMKRGFLYLFEIAYKKRTLGKSKCSKKRSLRFAVSLNSRKRKGTTANSQVQKTLESLLTKCGKFGKSEQEGGFIGAILSAPLWSLFYLLFLV